MNLGSKEKIVSEFADRGHLLDPNLIEEDEESLQKLYKRVERGEQDFPTTLTKEYLDVLEEREPESVADKVSEELEKQEEKEKNSEEVFLKVKKNYQENDGEKTVRSFVRLYKDRYRKITSFLRKRKTYKNTISISKLENKEKEEVNVIGIVKDKKRTNSGNFLLRIEDPTGTIKCLIKEDKGVFNKGKKIVKDEVIGIKGFKSNDWVFVNQLHFPDVPNHQKFKEGEKNGYAAFLADTHIGSEFFLEDKFQKCIDWLKGEIGTEKQKEIAEKTKYVFFLGDLVDGIGIYPGQEDELVIKNIRKQYEAFSEFIEQVPDRMKVVIIPGNHDALRLAEPQPALDKELASSIYKIDNVEVLSNPSTVSIGLNGKNKLDVLLYHGYSFDWYVSNVPYLRDYGYDGADKIMEFFLQKRHLAPTHSSTPFIPDPEDHMIIENVPDIFAAGHIHKAKIGSYKNVLNLCCSCFQETTPFQRWVGHHPQPGRVPVVNLKNKKTRIMKF